MRCNVCDQLEEAVARTHEPDNPELLQGLTEAGIRNRAHQREEKAVKLAADLEKHRRSCTKRDEPDPPTP